MALRAPRKQLEISSGHCAALLTRIAAGGLTEPFPVLFRRECHRWALQAPAAIRYVAGDGNRVILKAAVQDMSATGIGLKCEQDVPAGIPAEVFLTYKGRDYSAAVRVVRTASAPEGCRIGCEFVVQDEDE